MTHICLEIHFLGASLRENSQNKNKNKENRWRRSQPHGCYQEHCDKMDLEAVCAVKKLKCGNLLDLLVMSTEKNRKE